MSRETCPWPRSLPWPRDDSGLLVLSRTLPRQGSRRLRGGLGLVIVPNSLTASGLGAVYLGAGPCSLVFRIRIWSRRRPRSLRQDDDTQYPVSGARSTQNCVIKVCSFEKRSDQLYGWLRPRVDSDAFFCNGSVDGRPRRLADALKDLSKSRIFR